MAADAGFPTAPARLCARVGKRHRETVRAGEMGLSGHGEIPGNRPSLTRDQKVRGSNPFGARTAQRVAPHLPGATDGGHAVLNQCAAICDDGWARFVAVEHLGASRTVKTEFVVAAGIRRYAAAHDEDQHCGNDGSLGRWRRRWPCGRWRRRWSPRRWRRRWPCGRWRRRRPFRRWRRRRPLASYTFPVRDGRAATALLIPGWSVRTVKRVYPLS